MTSDNNIPRPDLLIVARGGGSLEDLMAFNEENVVRAAAASEIPIISAVGHETDTTLIDFAADLRAPTPTGAAEMAVPVRADLVAQIAENEGRLQSAAARLLSEFKHKLEAQSAKLGDPSKLLEIKSQNLDHLGEKLRGIYSAYISTKREALTNQAAHLQSPKALLKNASDSLMRWNEQLERTGSQITKDPTNKLNNLERTLEAYSFKKTLERGFTVIRNTNGALITDAKTALKNENLSIEFKDENFVNVSTETSSKPPQKQKKTKTRTPDQNQQSLF